MKFKKSLLAILAMSSVAGVAQAEVSIVANDKGSLELYGILDVGIAQLTNAGNFNPSFVTGAVPTGSTVGTGTPGVVRGMMNGGESQTRWGIKGNRDLGNGNKVFFQLESAFNLDSGQLATSGLAGGNNTGVGANASRSMIADTSLNGQQFNRNAFVGLSNADLGAISFGRQNSLQLDVITAIGGGYDPVNAQMFSPINFSGAYGGGGATDNARVDSAIKYAKKIGNININALYGMGGIENATSARSNAQLNVGYEADTFGVQVAMQQANDSTAISANATPNTVNVKFEDLTSYMVTGRYQVIEPLTLKAGYEREEISAPSNPSADAGLTNIYNYSIGTGSDYSGAQKNVNIYWLGANYQATSSIKASAAFYDVSTPAYGTTLIDGTDKYYSAMVEYNFDKQTNVYAAFMLDKKSGNMLTYGTTGAANFNTYGVGVRYKF